MAATQKEIAAKFGVSQGLVSQLVNGKWPAKTKLHRDILRECERCGYKPSHAASVLRTGRRHAWGLVIPKFSYLADFNRQIVQGIWDVAQAKGYSLSVSCLSESASDEDEYLRFLREGRFDGLFLLDDNLSRPIAYDAIDDHRSCAVVLNCSKPSGEVNHISTDGADGICQAVRHLAEVHHRRKIAFVYRDANSRLMEDRYAGYLRGLHTSGLTFDESRVHRFVSDASYEQNAATAVQRFVKSKVSIDAVVCPADSIAVPLMSSLGDHGLRVPAEVSVIGFDDHPICTSVRPRLTTIHCDGIEMGQHAAHMMLDALDGRPVRGDVLATSLVVRQSCGCA